MIHIYKNSPDSITKLNRILLLSKTGDSVVFVGDGVLNAFLKNKFDVKVGISFYCLANDIDARGLRNPIIGSVISMEQFVELIASDLNSPISW